MKVIKNKENILEVLNNKAVLLYFNADNCSICKVLKPKLEDKISKIFPKISFCEINSNENLELVSNFGVFSFPTILVFFEGKEFKRYGRNISLDIFEKEIQRLYEMVF